MSSQTTSRNEILLVTIDHVPGREIEQAIGVVLGHGDTWFGTSSERVTASRTKAISDLRSKAAAAGADAVVGMVVTVSGVKGWWGTPAFGQSAVVQAYGTAVKLKP
jgi:uncharacterized protein YbjQ (UPF0145 family)